MFLGSFGKLKRKTFKYFIDRNKKKIEKMFGKIKESFGKKFG